jgi:hypothetical protein
MEPTENAAAVAEEPVLPITPQQEPSSNPEPSMADRMRQFLGGQEEPEPKPDNPTSTEQKPEQPTSTTTEQDPDAPKEPKAKAKWGELKKAKEEYEEFKASKLPALEKELTDLRERAEKLSAVDPTRYEAQIAEKEKALAEYEQKLALYDIRESRPFKEQVLQPLTKIGQDADRLAATYGISGQDLKDALTIADPKAQFERLNELMENFDPIHKAKVFTMVEKTQETYEKAGELERNAVDAKKEMDFLNHQEAEKQKGERQKQLTVSAEAVRKQMLEHLPLLKDEAVAKDVFAADLDPQDPTMKTYNAYAGQVLKHVVKSNRSLEAKVKELEGELAKRASLGVRAGGSNGFAPPAPKPDQPEGGSLWARATAAGVAVKTR